MLFLVRHAHSDWSPDETRPLSDRGRVAAELVADVLVSLSISAIYSSPYTRAIQTVQPLSERLSVPVRIEPDLRERRLSDGPLDNVESAIAVTWNDFDFAWPGGESSRAAQGRVTRAISRIVQTAAERDVVIASHGNAIALFLRGIDAGVDRDFWARMSMPDVYVIDNATQGWGRYERLAGPWCERS